MKASIFLTAIIMAAFTAATTVSYDPGYDLPSHSMNDVSCSDGANGLTTRYGWQTQDRIPNFPHIGGSSTIAGWNSPQCGQCFAVTYLNRTVHILAIDRAASGLNIGEKAMDELTDNQAVQLGRVEADVTGVASSNCGLSSA